MPLREEQRSENPHSDSADPTRTYESFTDAERQYFEHGDASAIIAAEQAASPATRRLAEARQRAERDQERETWGQYNAPAREGA
jgi:hypothetical protein